jgi:hypothetical protein
MGKERLLNPKTGHYYRRQQRTTSKRQRGQIQGRWHRDR